MTFVNKIHVYLHIKWNYGAYTLENSIAHTQLFFYFFIVRPQVHKCWTSSFKRAFTVLYQVKENYQVTSVVFDVKIEFCVFNVYTEVRKRVKLKIILTYNIENDFFVFFAFWKISNLSSSISYPFVGLTRMFKLLDSHTQKYWKRKTHNLFSNQTLPFF